MITGSLKKDLMYQLRYGNVIMRLILLNAAVFLCYSLVAVVGFLFSAPSAARFLSENLMACSSWAGMLYKPWTLFTYQFFHIGLFHIVFNLLWLYWFGDIYRLYAGDRHLVGLYLAGGVFGWLVYALAMHLLPALQPQAESSRLLGASGGIMAIVFAAVAFNPHHNVRLLFLGDVRILHIALFMLFLDLLNVMQGGAGTYFAHLGGAVFGYAYVALLRRGVSLFGTKRKSPVKLAHKNTPGAAVPVEADAETQKKLDAILDKISRSGYDSLSKAEKDFLFRYSQKN